MLCLAVGPAGQPGEEGERVRGHLQQVGGAAGQRGGRPLVGEGRGDEDSP